MYYLTTLEREESALALQRPTCIDRCNLPIFNQDWWINIASAASNFRELKVATESVTLGRLPLVLTRNRLGLVHAHDPHWSHLGGPIIDENLTRGEQAEVIDLLLEQLPRWTSFRFVCDPNSAYAEIVKNAFMRRGFEHSAQVTFVRYPLDGEILGGRKGKHRGHIRRAARELECVDIGGRRFVDFFETNLKARGKKSYCPTNSLSRLIDEAIARGQARAIAAVPRHAMDPSNRDQAAPYDAAIVYCWDNLRCYYWLSTNRPQPADNSSPRSHPDAIKLLAVSAMEDAEAMGLIFDADGVTTPGTQNLYRNMFGLRQEVQRNVFQRWTVVHRLHEICRPRLQAFTK